MMEANALEKLIVALDYTSYERSMGLVDLLGDQITWYKVGPTLYMQHGKQVIDTLHKKKKKIFLDLKIHDTPRVVSDTVSQFAGMGIEMASLHCLGGREMLEAANQQCRGTQLKLIGVTLLTSQVSTEPLFNNLLDLAIETRLQGILCSAHEIPLIRKRSPRGFLSLAAGIRIQSNPVYQDDQKRIATAKEALDLGADHIIVGRPIIQAREPFEALKELYL